MTFKTPIHNPWKVFFPKEMTRQEFMEWVRTQKKTKKWPPKLREAVCDKIVDLHREDKKKKQEEEKQKQRPEEDKEEKQKQRPEEDKEEDKKED